jgi:hypothetical protein
MPVVDELEAVEIDQQQRHPAPAARSIDRCLELVPKCRRWQGR